MKNKLLLILFYFFFCISVLAQGTASPRKGEGTLRFLQRHGYSGKDISEFERINQGKFGKAKSLLLGTYYNLPGKKAISNTSGNTSNINKGKKQREPLFGDKYQDYEIKSKELDGAHFFLISGHGGPDPGTVATINGQLICEDEYAYDVMLRLARNLKEYGAKVDIIIQDEEDGIRDGKYLGNGKKETCRGDIIPKDKRARLKQRVNSINNLSKKSKSKYKRAVFIHIDSAKDKKGRPVPIDIYFLDQKHNPESKKMATTMLKIIKNKYAQHQPNKEFKDRFLNENYYVMNYTEPTAVLVELANINCPQNHKRLLLSDNRQAMANWMREGLIQDYKNSKI